MNKAYEFISYPYESFALVPKTTTTLTIHDQDVGLDDLLLEFTKFLRASGYIIDSDQYLSIISDEELEELEEQEWFSEEEEESLSWMSLPDVEEFGKKFEAIKHNINNLQGVTRVEVIDAEGRAYVNTNAAYVVIDLQDEGRTLKVFLK